MRAETPHPRYTLHEDKLPDEVESILVTTARPQPGYANWEQGAGYVDAYAAVQAARSQGGLALP